MQETGETCKYSDKRVRQMREQGGKEHLMEKEWKAKDKRYKWGYKKKKKSMTVTVWHCPYSIIR